MKIALVLLSIAVLGVAGFFIILYSGIISVAATNPDPPGMDWVLFTGSKYSVRRHSRNIRPPDMTSPTMAAAGARLYQGLCVMCHGAPGLARSSVGVGLNPLPPPLSQAKPVWTAAQVFVFIKSGVKMTGMPAFGPSYPDSALWEITALVKKLPSLSEEQYRDLAQGTAAAEGPGRDDKGVGPVEQVVLGPLNGAMASRGAALLTSKCFSCHALYVPLTGPPLGGIFGLRTPEYIMNMMLNPGGMGEKDPLVKKMVSDYGGLAMPQTGLDSAQARDILEYLRTTLKK
jgi:mono/diheme cytochrome c family protein